MLIFVTFAFLILTMPIYIRYIILIIFDCDLTPKRDAICFLFINITNRLYYINNMVNFYMYIMSSVKFRKDTKDLIRLSRCSKGNSVMPMHDGSGL